MTTYFKVTLVALLFGLIGGVVGQILADAYISPLIEIFPDSPTDQVKSIPELKRSSEFTGTDNDILVNQVVNKAKEATVGIYRASASFGRSSFLGNGTILTSDGWLLSHQDVTGNLATDQLKVIYKNEAFAVEELASDSLTGATFLKINKQNLPVVTFNDWQVLFAGQAVVAINAFNDTLVTNIENKMWDSDPATNRNTETFDVYIALRDNANSNFDGAVVYNLGGTVVGLLTTIQNRSVAIPPNYFINKIPSVLKDKIIERPELGVQYQNLATTIGLLEFGSKGALITSSPAGGSPADQAGIEINDIVTQVNGVEVDAQNDLALLVQDHRVGDQINLTVVRDGEEINLEIFLGKL
ncbi:MAG: hypothetical protein COT81_04520 [Candidatus Buchananbacteria bacterium CG10_big_fil_rev_8_21_14_0_10_42_9]|uniref:PDZ domain-containing protein n=1 Tax=Candidatus Buchananbacteria bacterium CG10_big_fil_rev_8_21_14_0_10_42_9 TaxID=1974526 RepID=A0A2H0W0A4_9BACT|nr:MAG: hypothetical protein COT81_04520 [Candidatus Buchananbacteria bacterium CG10_big_fil_rev_8_21_14_0_10_42_9]